MVLVDSSIYIDLLRARRDPSRELFEAFGRTNVVGCGIVRCEVMRGVIGPVVRERLSSFLDLVLQVEMNDRIWRATEALAWQLDRAGKVLPLPDLIIAVCAIHAGAALLTNDKHFALIPQLQLASW